MTRAILGAALVLLWLPVEAEGQIQQQVIRDAWYIHTNVADQIDLAELRLYLQEARRLFELTQDPANDVACCVHIDPIDFEIFGDPNDGLDVIDGVSEWVMLGDRKVIVQTLNWCGVPTIAFGCSQSPGARLAVALDAQTFRLGQIMAHELGHSVGLPHRVSPSCSLMRAQASPALGCVTVAECNAFRAAGTAGGSCDCMGPVVGDSTFPPGVPCVEEGVAGQCFGLGLCAPLPAEDRCVFAEPIASGSAALRANEGASSEASASCAAFTRSDLWYAYTATCTGDVVFQTCDSGGDTVVSVHAACDGQPDLGVCSDDCPAGQIAGCRASASCTGAPLVFGDQVRVRVAAKFGERGPFVLRTGDCITDFAADTDADGLPDHTEYGTLRLDHRNADTDGDGFVDGVDNCPDLANPLQTDDDANGVGDACQCGDVNSNRVLEMLDSVLLARELAMLPPGLPAPEHCDVSGSAACDAEDLLAGRMELAGFPGSVQPLCLTSGGG